MSQTIGLQKSSLFGVSSPIVVLVIALVVTALYRWMQWRYSRRHLYELAAQFPYPQTNKPWPLVGHAPLYYGSTKRIYRNTMKTADDNAKTATKVWLGHRLFIIILRPEDFEVVLNSPNCIEKDDLQKFLRTLVGTGLFTAPAPQWKKNRKLINQSFNQKILDQFVEIFVKQSRILTGLLKKREGEMFNIFDMISNCTLDAVAEAAMDTKVNAQTTDSVFAKSIVKSMDIGMIHMFNVPYHFDFIYNMTQLPKKEKEASGHIHRLTDSIIAEKKKTMAAKQQDKNLNYEEAPPKKAFLELLMDMSENGKKFTDRELRDEVNTLIIAGSDTTATTIGFALLMLALHKDVEQKYYEEVMEVIGPTRDVEPADLPKFHYGEKVLKETMRIFPVGPINIRKVLKDTKLDGGLTMPKGAGIVLHFGGLMRSAKYWPDPLKFDPERFTPEQIAKRHPYSYLPFSAGARNCIGGKYGMMQMKTIISNLVRKYRFETSYTDVESIELRQAIVIKAVDGFPIKLIPRD